MSSPPKPSGLEWVSADTLLRWQDDPAIELLGPAPEQLSAAGRHRLLRVLPGDGRRSGWDLRAKLADGTTETLTVTMPATRMMEMLRAAFADQRTFELYGFDAEPAPDWAGVRSMPAVTQSLEQVSFLGQRAETGTLGAALDHLSTAMANTPLVAASITAIHQLRHAVPIVVDPQTMAGLPSFDDLEEAFAYGEMMALPFPFVYIDCSDRDGRGTPVEVAVDAQTTATFELLGASVCRSHDGGVAITPFANNAASSSADNTPELFGRAVFDVDPPTSMFVSHAEVPIPCWERKMKTQVLPASGALLLDAAVGGQQDRDPLDLLVKGYGNQLRGRLELAGSVDLAALLGQDSDADPIPALARVLMALACEILGVFYFLDAPGTELTPAALPRPERRRAEREGRPLAKTVQLVPKAASVAEAAEQITRAAVQGSQPRRHSYKYLVRGSWAHYPSTTRMAQARPDLVRPCPRPRCRGSCRRILRPPHWRGPEGGQVVLKTRVLPLRAVAQAPPPDAPPQDMPDRD